MAEGVPTNNQRGQRSGPCRLWGGLDKARHIVQTFELFSIQMVLRLRWFKKLTFKLNALLKRAIILYEIIYVKDTAATTLFKEYTFVCNFNIFVVPIAYERNSSWGCGRILLYILPISSTFCQKDLENDFVFFLILIIDVLWCDTRQEK